MVMSWEGCLGVFRNNLTQAPTSLRPYKMPREALGRPSLPSSSELQKSLLDARPCSGRPCLHPQALLMAQAAQGKHHGTRPHPKGLFVRMSVQAQHYCPLRGRPSRPVRPPRALNKNLLPALPRTGCVMVGKSLALSEPWFLHL